MMRITWFALLAGEAMFLAVMQFLPQDQARSAQRNPDPGIHNLQIVNLIMFLVLVPGAFMVRSLIYRRFRDPETGAVIFKAYGIGNMVFWAACEGVVLMGLVGLLMGGKAMPGAIAPTLAAICQVLAFPTGSPLRNS